MNINDYIRDVADFPKKGIVFKDISPLLASPEALAATIDEMAAKVDAERIDKIGAFDARGFIFGPLLAAKLSKPFFMIRKAGKLPGDTLSESYDLEYGSATVEIVSDAVSTGESVLLVDDLLATGGTARAGALLVEKAGGSVYKMLFVAELSFLPGRSILAGYDVDTLISYTD